jgi:uncharacterized membrane protein
MKRLNSPLRNTFLAGIFAAIPIAVTLFVIWYIEHATRVITHELLGVNVPFLGVLLALAAIYALGLLVSSIVGIFFLRIIDWILLHVPVLRELYRAWKQVTLTPGGKEGMWAKVVLIAADNPETRMLGFTSGDAIPGDPDTCCVFVPGVPNPVTGRLYFVRRDRCQFLEITTDEAFKFILSMAN